MNKQNNSERRIRQSNRHKLFAVIYQLLIALLIALSITLFSCTEYHFSTPSDSCLVRIRPDNSRYQYDLSGLEYRFYSADTCIIRSGDADGNFEGTLPWGTYRVLATNTNAERATFAGLNTYETATVGAPALSDSEDTDPDIPEQWSPVDTIGKVYSVCVEELKVRASGAVEKTPSIDLLTRELVFIFELAGGLDIEVTSMRGVLPGVYPSVSLTTGFPGAESLSQSSQTAVAFSVPATNGQCSARLGLLGLRDPENSRAYDCDLALILLMIGDGREEIEISMSSLFSEILMKNEGVFPRQLYIYITIAPDIAEGGAIGGIIRSWGTGEGGTVSLTGGSGEGKILLPAHPAD
jgi:hypothetical protein